MSRPRVLVQGPEGRVKRLVPRITVFVPDCPGHFTSTDTIPRASAVHDAHPAHAAFQHPSRCFSLRSAAGVGGAGGAPQRRERPRGGAAPRLRRGGPGLGRPRRLRQAVGAAPRAAAPGAGHRAALQRWGQSLCDDAARPTWAARCWQSLQHQIGDQQSGSPVCPGSSWPSACGMTVLEVCRPGSEGCQHVECRARLLCGCAAAPPPRGHRCGISPQASIMQQKRSARQHVRVSNGTADMPAQRDVACCAGLQFVDDGLVVCGMDGALRFFPFAGM